MIIECSSHTCCLACVINSCKVAIGMRVISEKRDLNEHHNAIQQTSIHDPLTRPHFSQLETRYDAHTCAIWCWMKPTPRPCLNPTLLNDLVSFRERVAVAYQNEQVRSQYPFSHAILASRIPGVYSYGGDLELFWQLITASDREGLRHYAYCCVDAVYQNMCNHNMPITMIALVQGQALGGGFETALSCDVIIAERQSGMGFPETLFNLFPGMGAYNLLARRINPGLAERLILSGQSYGAEELYEMGIVDILAEPGEGIVATERYLKNRNRSHRAVRCIKQVRRMTHPVSRQDLLDIVDLWVDAAMQLDSRDLQKMQRLIHAQNTLEHRNNKAGVVPIKRRGEWRSRRIVQFPITTHLGETILHDRRRNQRCRRQ